MRALVIKNTGSDFVARTCEGQDITCKIKGNFRIKGLKSTNPVAIGDWVELSESKGNYLISGIEERRNYIVRKPANLSKQLHIIAANMDLALLVVSLRLPETNLVFIDRFLATCEAYRVPACLVFNKIDLYTTADLDYLQALKLMYGQIGYTCFEISALKGEGIQALKAHIQGKICLLSGNSGVGKSSLLNALCPDIHAKTGDISDYHQTGKHTTSFSEMYSLGQDTYVIDTPGIKGFNTFDMQEEEVSHYFPEIFRASAGCKYHNCSHRHEPGCAVQEALAQHLISESRYRSYLSIMEDANEGKYREAD